MTTENVLPQMIATDDEIQDPDTKEWFIVRHVEMASLQITSRYTDRFEHRTEQHPVFHGDDGVEVESWKIPNGLVHRRVKDAS